MSKLNQTVQSLTEVASKATEKGGSILFDFGDKVGCKLETTDPNFAYYVSMWLSERIDFPDLIRMLYTTHNDYAIFLLDFVKSCGTPA